MRRNIHYKSKTQISYSRSRKPNILLRKRIETKLKELMDQYQIKPTNSRMGIAHLSHITLKKNNL